LYSKLYRLKHRKTCFGRSITCCSKLLPWNWFELNKIISSNLKIRRNKYRRNWAQWKMTMHNQEAWIGIWEELGKIKEIRDGIEWTLRNISKTKQNKKPDCAKQFERELSRRSRKQVLEADENFHIFKFCPYQSPQNTCSKRSNTPDPSHHNCFS